MKKSLFALAALGAFAQAAQAQSTVTLFGTLDSSIGYVTSVTPVVSTTVPSASTAITNAGSGTLFLDSGFATSNWGMRGSEDLGGGMKANFYVEGDLPTNNGATHNSGIFRRGANVSLSDAKLGEVFLGRRGSAYILATGQMLPVSGNTAHQWRTVINSSIGDQVSNSITYATPVIMNSNLVVQYGMNNTIDNGDDGSAFAAHFINKSISGLQITAAYNIAKAQNNVASTSNAYTVTTGAAVAGTASNANTGATTGTNTVTTAGANTEGYAVGLKYKVTPAIEVGSFYAHGRTNNGYANAAATTGISTGAGGFGVGYQATPNLLLGANYVKTTFQAQMTNLQAHYMLSKRTRIYSQVTLTQAAKGNNQLGSVSGLAARSFSPVNCGSNTSVPCAASLSGSAGAQNTPVNSNGYTVGILHTF